MGVLVGPDGRQAERNCVDAPNRCHAGGEMFQIGIIYPPQQQRDSPEVQHGDTLESWEVLESFLDLQARGKERH